MPQNKDKLRQREDANRQPMQQQHGFGKQDKNKTQQPSSIERDREQMSERDREREPASSDRF
jgi:hypothetical protein